MENLDPNECLFFFNEEETIIMDDGDVPDDCPEWIKIAEGDRSFSEPEEIADSESGETDFLSDDQQFFHEKGNRRYLAVDWIVRESRVHVRDNPEKDQKLNIVFEELLAVLNLIFKKSLYHEIRIRKKGGGIRLIHAPFDNLKKVQKSINRLLRKIEKPENAFGFSGGGIYDALKPHAKSKIIMTVDCKNAFPTVEREMIFRQLSKKRFSIPRMKNGKPVIQKVGHFSWYVSEIIANLTTLNGKMIQGPPTSPRLFDLCCEIMDQRLNALAKECGGIYTRYADNIIFSIDDEFFSDNLRKRVLEIIRGKGSDTAVRFEFHKLKIRKTKKGAVRSLGLNIIDGKIHNLRSFKRNIRLTIHRLLWLIYNGRSEEEYDPVWNKLKGMMNFANKETLPSELVKEYLKLEEALY